MYSLIKVLAFISLYYFEGAKTMSDTLLDKNKIWQQIDDEKENMLQLWQELVNVDCGSGNKAGVDFIAQKSKPF